MRKSTFKILKIAFVVMMIITIIFCLIISQDHNHLENCHDDHCSRCAIIHIAQAITQATMTVVIMMANVFFIQYVLSKNHKITFSIVHNSLVLQRVQFNE